MSVKVNLDGLKKLQRKARELDGRHQLRVSDLFTPSFLRAHTGFSSLDDLEAKARERGFAFSKRIWIIFRVISGTPLSLSIRASAPGRICWARALLSGHRASSV